MRLASVRNSLPLRKRPLVLVAHPAVVIPLNVNAVVLYPPSLLQRLLRMVRKLRYRAEPANQKTLFIWLNAICVTISVTLVELYKHYTNVFLAIVKVLPL